MRSHRLFALIGSIGFTSLASLAGCSSAPTDGGESTAEAFTYYQDVAINAPEFHAFVGLTADPGNWQASVTDNVATITPSQTAKNNLGVDVSTTTLPTISKSVDVCGTLTITIPHLSLDSGSFAMNLGDSTIDIDLTMSGSAHAKTAGILCPSPDIGLGAVPVHVSLGVANDNLFVKDVTVTLVGHTSPDCGAFGWCNGLVDGYVGDAQPQIAAQLKRTLVSALARATTQTGFRNGVLAADEQLLQIGHPQGATLAAGSIAIRNGALVSKIIYDAQSPAPTCSGSYACSSTDYHGSSAINCTGIQTGQTLKLYRWINGTPMFLTQRPYDASVYTPATFTDFYDPGAGETTLTYQVCVADSYGTTCGSPFGVANAKSCACTPSLACGREVQCGKMTDNCGTAHDCGSCAAGLTCTSGQCCAPGDTSPACAPPLKCHGGMSDCGGYCCKCGPRNPC